VAVAAQKFENFAQQFVELHVDQNYIFITLKTPQNLTNSAKYGLKVESRNKKIF
jgi:hypothetical protein